MKKKWFIISSILIIALIIISNNIDSFNYSKEFGSFLSMPLVFCIMRTTLSKEKFIREANKSIIQFTLGYVFFNCLDFFFAQGIDYTKIIAILSGGIFTLFIWNYILKSKTKNINAEAE